MKSLHDRKRTGVVALLSVFLGAAALFFGVGAAHAGYPCNDDSAPQDTTLNVNNQTFVGVDTNLTTGSPTTPWVWACAAATGGEGSQKFVVVTANPTGSAPGYTVQAGGCTGVVGGDPYGPGCTYLVKPTGAQADPVVTPNAPGGSTAGSGASAATGPTTCTWINGAMSCPGSLTLGGVTVNEGDASVPGVHTTPGSCVTVGGGCPATVPSGAGVDAFEGDSSNDTVTVEVLGSRTSRDLGDCYVGVNAPSAC